MDLLGVLLLGMIGGAFIGAAVGWAVGRDAGYAEGLRTDWNKVDIEDHEVY